MIQVGPILPPRPFNRGERPEAPWPDQYADAARFVVCPTCYGHGYLVLYDANYLDTPPTRPYCCSCMGEGFIDIERHSQK